MTAEQETMLLDNINLIKYCIKKMNLKAYTNDEYQNYFDDGLIGLINGIKTYSQDKSQLSTYLYTCIKNNICRGIYLSTMDKRKSNYNTISLDKAFDDTTENTYLEFIADEKVNIEEEVSKKIEIERLLECLEKLKRRDREWLKLYFGINCKEHTYNEIAVINNCSSGLVSSIIPRALKRLKKLMLNAKITERK